MKDMIIKLKLALKRLFGIKEHKHVSLWELYSILGENSVCYIGGKKVVKTLDKGKLELTLGVGEGVFIIPFAE